MSEPDLSRILYLGPGWLVSTPTDLTDPPLCGGTRLGAIRDCAVRIGQEVSSWGTPEYGAEVVEVVDLGRDWAFSGAFRGYDPDAWGLVFPGTQTVAGELIVTDGGDDSRAGLRGSERSVPLLFVPEAFNHDPALLLHAAIPNVARGAALTARLDAEATLGFFFQAIRHAVNKRSASLGRLARIAGRL